MIQNLVSFVISMFLVGTVVFLWLTASHSLRMRRVRSQYDSLPPETRERILNMIDQAGAGQIDCVLMVATEPMPIDTSVANRSHYGGVPYAQDDETWPPLAPDDSTPAPFMIQVLLHDALPSPWPGRLVVVFNQQEREETVRCYESPDVARYVPLPGAPNPEREWWLQAIRIPKQTKAEPVGESADEPIQGLLSYDPVVLLESVPGLRSELAPFTNRPADLLAAILAPNHSGYGFEMGDVVQLAGDPVWLHGTTEEPKCSQCGRPMRFLFQFGDLNGGILLGDGGVCYVFGCDHHPNDVRAVIEVT